LFLLPLLDLPSILLNITLFRLRRLSFLTLLLTLFLLLLILLLTGFSLLTVSLGVCRVRQSYESQCANHQCEYGLSDKIELHNFLPDN
jgi:hypothetical protein